MTNPDPVDPTSVWFVKGRQEAANWRASAIRACQQRIQAGHTGLEEWLTAVDDGVYQRTGNRLEKATRQWRHTAREYCRTAYASGGWEAAATELVYYIEEVACIYRQQLQTR